MSDNVGIAMAGVICQAVFGSLFGAMILRAACAWYNSLTGKSRRTSDALAAPAEAIQFPPASANPYEAPTVPSQWQSDNNAAGVPEPGFSKAWLISFAAILANGVIGFALGLVVGFGGAVAGVDGKLLMLLSLVVSSPVCFLVTAGLLAAMLPTSIGRAMIVTLLYLVISLAIGVVIGIVAVGIMLLLGGLR
jgi:hypothetical protein